MSAVRPSEPGTFRGWVNAHTHLYSGLAPLGLPDPVETPRTFVEILERIWWKLDRALDEASLRAAARLYVAEALLAGTTGLCDHHESPEFIEGSLDVLADACQDLGMRAVLCYGVTERNGGRPEAERGLAECRRFLATNRRALVHGAVGVHASFTVSEETLVEAGELAREFDTVVHVHVAEDAADVTDARSRGHAGPLQRLFATDSVPPGSILAHGVHLAAEDVRAAAAHGLWLVQNPRSNENNRVGYPAWLAESPLVALGTDGFPSDMDDEFAQLLGSAVAHGEDPAHAVPRLEAGAELLEHLFGQAAPAIEVGLGSLVVAGRAVVQDGRLVNHDLDEIRAEAREEAKRLWQRMRDL